MARSGTSLYLVLIVAIVALLGLGLSASSFLTDESIPRMMGGNGMMGGTGGTISAARPGAIEWMVLILSIAFFVLAVVLLLRGRGEDEGSRMPGRTPEAMPLAPQAPLSPGVPGTVNEASATPPALTGAVPEPALVKLLSEDERRMYLEIRGHGGEMLQRDLVALGIFSKAKVTRILDKLEAKGIAVREAHGMTNRVRLVNLPAR